VLVTLKTKVGAAAVPLAAGLLKGEGVRVSWRAGELESWRAREDWK
jgi:hypothetical protein